MRLSSLNVPVLENAVAACGRISTQGMDDELQQQFSQFRLILEQALEEVRDQSNEQKPALGLLAREGAVPTAIIAAASPYMQETQDLMKLVHYKIAGGYGNELSSDGGVRISGAEGEKLHDLRDAIRDAVGAARDIGEKDIRNNATLLLLDTLLPAVDRELYAAQKLDDTRAERGETGQEILMDVNDVPYPAISTFLQLGETLLQEVRSQQPSTSPYPELEGDYDFSEIDFTSDQPRGSHEDRLTKLGNALEKANTIAGRDVTVAIDGPSPATHEGVENIATIDQGLPPLAEILEITAGPANDDIGKPFQEPAPPLVIDAAAEPLIIDAPQEPIRPELPAAASEVIEGKTSYAVDEITPVSTYEPGTIFDRLGVAHLMEEAGQATQEPPASQQDNRTGTGLTEEPESDGRIDSTELAHSQSLDTADAPRAVGDDMAEPFATSEVVPDIPAAAEISNRLLGLNADGTAPEEPATTAKTSSVEAVEPVAATESHDMGNTDGIAVDSVAIEQTAAIPPPPQKGEISDEEIKAAYDRTKQPEQPQPDIGIISGNLFEDDPGRTQHMAAPSTPHAGQQQGFGVSTPPPYGTAPQRFAPPAPNMRPAPPPNGYAPPNTAGYGQQPFQGTPTNGQPSHVVGEWTSRTPAPPNARAYGTQDASAGYGTPNAPAFPNHDSEQRGPRGGGSWTDSISRQQRPPGYRATEQDDAANAIPRGSSGSREWVR